MRRRLVDLFLLLLLSTGFSATALADALSRLEVTVTGHGAALAGASVTVTCGTTTRAATTDGSGQVAFPNLPAGSCTVAATATGFTQKSAKAKLGAGATASVSLALAATPAKDEERKVERQVSKRKGPSAVQPSVARSPAPPAPPPPAGQVDGDDPNHNTEAYSKIDENPFFATATAPLSTFSADVDTASYSNLRRFLREGKTPPRDAIRIEEMINYFKYDYPAPAKGEPFSITTEVGPAPWDANHQLVRIGLAAPAIAASQVPARNLVFLLDVSGSMSAANKLPLLKQAMNLVIETLRPQDSIAVVVYAGASGMALQATKGSEKDTIRQAIFALAAGGSTNGAAGIELAYQVAESNFKKKGINRVILATDGDFNVGTTSEGDLTRLIEEKREKGVFLTVLGFGMGNYKDSTMEKLADRGNGNYAYIDTIEEARKVLVKEAGATLVTVAKDVKLQVEFNPALVAGYRLIGYENRVMRNEDFNDDKKDAGEIGAGHHVTAIYELVPAGQAVPSATTDELKYQTKPQTKPDAAASKELLTVKVRYKKPDGNKSTLLSRAVTGSIADLAKTSDDFRWVAAMAGFGMMLRESPHKGTLTWKQVASLAEGAKGKDAEGYRTQSLEMITLASKLTK